MHVCVHVRVCVCGGGPGKSVMCDHSSTIFDFLCSGTVYTCGLNDAHQLGHGSNPSTAPQSCLAPKALQVCVCV